MEKIKREGYPARDFMFINPFGVRKTLSSSYHSLHFAEEEM